MSVMNSRRLMGLTPRPRVMRLSIAVSWNGFRPVRRSKSRPLMSGSGQTRSCGYVGSNVRFVRKQTLLGYSPLRLACRAYRQTHGKDRALARLARHRHIAAHHARELARDRKSKTSAAEALRGRLIGLGELLEQLG